MASQYNVKFINAHDGLLVWDGLGIEAESHQEAYEAELQNWSPARPVSLLVWVTNLDTFIVYRFEIGLA